MLFLLFAFGYINESEYQHALSDNVGNRVQKVAQVRKEKAGYNSYYMDALMYAFVDDLQETIDFFTENGGEMVTPVIREGDSRELVNIRSKNGDLYSVIHHIK